ncbi:EAL domain-containing protein [Maritimibacter alkaliphilus]|uniref:EAL domain-containing protein n=1 Tax=Maritimibacter alkaliphilus TaxID=404236 RepID=UPI001C950684|nr:EAL domain-containing protein [Maritimibacter alkaliphilus]MBY6089127.1 EAL domain-containing protein [Maritimibacter alkaliphilus]
MQAGRRDLRDIPAGARDPLSAAIGGRDAQTLEVVRRAVAARDVLLAFQPVVDARDPRRVAFYEGLIRILDPEGRPVPAGDFLPAVEATPTGREIDCLALEMGLEVLARQPDIRLSINMSARSIGYRRWLQVLRAGLMRDETVGPRLILEMSEPSVMQVPELVTAFMADLQRQGISFALDDFGTGVTVLRYFRDFLFDIAKIDGTFVRGVARDADNQALVGALIDVARQFDMFTVAEAVERAADAAWLSEAGVDCLQGYYFGAPTVHPPWHLPEVRTGT